MVLINAPAFASVLAVAPEDRIIGVPEICWFRPVSESTSALIGEMETYFTEQIQERAGIPLKFSGDCLKAANPFTPIGIAFYDDPLTGEGIKNEIHGLAEEPQHPGHPYTYEKGIWATRSLVDIVLTSRFEAVADSLAKQAAALSATGQANLLKSIALHEVLHGLGFAHEHVHKDSTCPTLTEIRVTAEERLLTEYDRQSIMNYCLTHGFDFESGPIPLSEKDIEGLRAIYALKTARPVEPYTH